MPKLSIDSVIPSFAGLLLRDATAEYAEAKLLDGERQLDEAEIRHLVLASCFIAVEANAILRGFDQDRVRTILTDSMFSLREYPMVDRRNAVILAHDFSTYPIIRADHAFEDWICEALWHQFQTIPYEFPSAMSGVIAQGLRVMVALDKVELEISEATDASPDQVKDS